MWRSDVLIFSSQLPLCPESNETTLKRTKHQKSSPNDPFNIFISHIVTIRNDSITLNIFLKIIQEKTESSSIPFCLIKHKM